MEQREKDLRKKLDKVRKAFLSDNKKEHFYHWMGMGVSHVIPDLEVGDTIEVKINGETFWSDTKEWVLEKQSKNVFVWYEKGDE